MLVGKHGDHIGGEREAVKRCCAGKADAACIIDAQSPCFAREGTLPAGATRVLAQTPAYDHCNFTVLDGVQPQTIARFRELLLAMSYDDPEVRPLLDLEGLKVGAGRVKVYAQLDRAVDAFGVIDAFVTEVEAQCR